MTSVFARTYIGNSYPSRCRTGSITVAANAVATRSYTKDWRHLAAVVQHASAEFRSYGLLQRGFLCNEQYGILHGGAENRGDESRSWRSGVCGGGDAEADL